ncbi:MAG: hypothetical protein K6B68_05950 [Eubacterium sp.]|nr:hypothetical protein [Eubacterium sp.]
MESVSKVSVELIMSIILEQLTEENYKYALAINRDDIPEKWVDTAETIMEVSMLILWQRLNSLF